MNKKVLGGIVVVLIVLLGIWFFSAPEEDDTFAYVQSPEECTSYEEYDPEGRYCYYECDTEEECLAIEELIDEELDSFGDAYETFAGDFNEQYEDEDIAAVTEVRYQVASGEDFIVLEGSETSVHQQIVGWIRDVFPDEFSDRYLAEAGIFFDPESDTGAFVSMLDTGGWELFVNRDVLSESENEMIFSVIHEFAHILSLKQ